MDYKYLDYSLSNDDDWNLLVTYKILKEDFPTKLQIIWKEHGSHVASQIIYIGMLEKLFGLNYKVFDLTNILFKILATLSVYPLILLIFKRKLLAFLTTVFYAISYSSIGTLNLIVKGTEYQAIFFMNIFLIIYYITTRNQTISLKWICALIGSFSLAILLAPPRMFPLTVIPLLVELFLWLHSQANYNFQVGIKKLFFLYFPFILLVIFQPIVITGVLSIPFTLLQKILEGNWHIILTPLSGLGYMIFWDNSWVRLLGTLNMDNFSNYLFFILSNPTILFGSITIILSLIISKNRWRFILISISLNFIFEVLVFFLATNHMKITEVHRINFDYNALYSVFIGIFVIVISISCCIEWLIKGKKNQLLLALWLGPLMSFWFIFGTWLFADYLQGYGPSHEYLTAPAIGISLMTSALLTYIYDKLKAIRISNLGNTLAFGTLLIAFFPLYSISANRTNDYLSGLIRKGEASQQQEIQERIREKIKESSLEENNLFFFDLTNNTVNGELYGSIIDTIPHWIHFQKNGNIVGGCTATITDKRKLMSIVSERDGKKGFLSPGVCVEKKSETNMIKPAIFYELNNFYAFEIINNNLIDIRDHLLNEIGLNN